MRFYCVDMADEDDEQVYYSSLREARKVARELCDHDGRARDITACDAGPINRSLILAMLNRRGWCALQEQVETIQPRNTKGDR